MDEQGMDGSESATGVIVSASGVTVPSDASGAIIPTQSGTSVSPSPASETGALTASGDALTIPEVIPASILSSLDGNIRASLHIPAQREIRSIGELKARLAVRVADRNGTEIPMAWDLAAGSATSVATDRGSGGYIVTLSAPQTFVPGMYRVVVTLHATRGETRLLQKFFREIGGGNGEAIPLLDASVPLGFMAWNVDRSTLSSGQAATVAVSLAGDAGEPLCGGDLTIAVRAADGALRTFDTASETVQRQTSCAARKFITAPDFASTIPFGGTGIARLAITPEDSARNIQSLIEVAPDHPLDILRSSVTRTWPGATEDMTITVTPAVSFIGNITERIPADYEILFSEPHAVQSNLQDGTMTITWDRQWDAGVPVTLRYTYRSPADVPRFSVFGPLEAQGTRIENVVVPSPMDTKTGALLPAIQEIGSGITVNPSSGSLLSGSEEIPVIDASASGGVVPPASGSGSTFEAPDTGSRETHQRGVSTTDGAFSGSSLSSASSAASSEELSSSSRGETPQRDVSTGTPDAPSADAPATETGSLQSFIHWMASAMDAIGDFILSPLREMRAIALRGLLALGDARPPRIVRTGDGDGRSFAFVEPRGWQQLSLAIQPSLPYQPTDDTLTLTPRNGDSFDANMLPSFTLLQTAVSGTGSEIIDGNGHLREEKALARIVEVITPKTVVEREVLEQAIGAAADEIAGAVTQDTAALNTVLAAMEESGARRTSRVQEGAQEAVTAVLREDGGARQKTAEMLGASERVREILKTIVTDAERSDIIEHAVEQSLTGVSGSVGPSALADPAAEILVETIARDAAMKQEVAEAVRDSDIGRERVSKSEIRSPILSLTLTDADGRTFSPAYHFVPGSVVLVLEPDRQFRPGLYTLSMTVTNPLTQEERVLTQDFAWGVLAMNANQDRYETGDRVQLAFGVLDDRGEIICDAALKLVVTAPGGDSFALSTDDQSIAVTGTCGAKKAGLITPDYEAFFTAAEAGTYELKLAAETGNGAREMSQQLEIKGQPPQPGTAAAGDQIMGNRQPPSVGAASWPIIITRKAATRLWPFAPSPMEVTVKFNEDFAGTITETVPEGFEISEISSNGALCHGELCRTTAQGVSPFDSAQGDTTAEQLIEWKGSWSAGETAVFNYTYDAPDVSPQFFLLGPLALSPSPDWQAGGTERGVGGEAELREARTWQIASDAADLSLTLWAKKRKITISNANVDENLTDFPLSVKITADADIGALARSDGYDIRFASTTGALLSYEREEYHVSSGSGSGVFWVKIPRIDADTDTEFYIYYGRKDAGDGSSASSVWDTNFKGVWHMNQTSTGALSAADSTSNANNGGVSGATASGGKIDGGGGFDGTDDNVELGDIDIGSGTWSAWINPAQFNDHSYHTIVAKDYNEAYWFGLFEETGQIQLWVAGIAHHSQSQVTTSTWSYITATWDGSTIKYYINGSYLSGEDNAEAGAAVNNNLNAHLGYDWYDYPGNQDKAYQWTGRLDDVRISSVARSAAWIKFEYNNMNSIGQELTWEGTGTQAAEQVISGWPYKKKFTVSKTNVDSNLSDFPLYVKVRADSDLGRDALSTGYDIRFTTSTGVLLPYEREQYHVRSGSGSGDFWVKVPTVSTSADTDLYLYYGKRDATDGNDPTNVWDSSYKGVWHLGQTSTGALSAGDSTSNANNGGVAGATNAAGQVNGAGSFNGSSNYISVPDTTSLSITGQLTMSAWVKPDALSQRQGIFEKYSATNNDRGYALDTGPYTGSPNVVPTGAVFTVSSAATPFTGAVKGTDGTFAVGQWAYVTAVFSPSTFMKVFRNGSEQSLITSYANQDPPTAINDNSRPLWIGDGEDDAVSPFDGTLDELRISATPRSADWIKFEYHNMADADNAITWETKTNTLDGWTLRKPITISKTNVDSTLTDFPLYVKIRADADLGTSARSDGYDIRFTTSTGVILPYERENFHIRTGSGAGDFWVKVPRVSSTADTLLYMYYGKADAADGEDKTNVWDSSYKGVWHLGQTSSGALSAADSTTNANNGGVAGATNAAGQVGGAGGFSGTQYIDLGSNSSLDFTDNFTIESWVNTSSGVPGSNAGIFGRIPATSDAGYQLASWNGTLAFGWYGSTPSNHYTGVTVNANPSAGTWHHLVGVSNANVKNIYLDGVLQTSTQIDTIASANINAVLGRWYGNYDGYYVQLPLDESRISATPRSAAWIKFEYQNMASETNEITIGEDQSAQITGTVYSDTGATVLSGKTVRLAVNGVDQVITAESNAVGAFTMSGASFVQGDVLTFYLEDETQDAVTVTTASGGSMTGIDLYQDYLIVRNDSGSALTNANLATAAVSGETDISGIYAVAGGNLTTVNGKTLLVATGATLTPGGTISVGTSGTTSAMKTYGTVNMGSNALTVYGSFTQSNGTFNGGSADSRIWTDLSLTGGTYTATSGTMTINQGAYSGNSSTFIVGSGATFSHGNGTVLWSGFNTQINVPSSLNFYNMEVNGNTSTTFVIANGDMLVVNGTLTLTDGFMVGGTIGAKGAVSVASTFGYSFGNSDAGGPTILLIDGTGDQSFMVPDGATLPSITLNNANTTISFAGANSSIEKSLVIQAGTFTAPSGILEINHSQYGGDSLFTVSGGTFNHNNGTVKFRGYATFIDVNSRQTFYNMEVNGNQYATFTIAADDTLVVQGTLTLTAGLINSGTIDTRGNVMIASTFGSYSPGTTALTLSGSSAQTFELESGGVQPTGAFTINKSNGTLTVSGSLALGASPTSTGSITVNAGSTLTVASGTWYVNTSPDYGINSTITNNGTITHSGNGWDLNKASLTNNGTITYAGTAMTLEQSLTQNGTFDLTGKTVTFDGNATSWESPSTITCSGNLGGTIVISKNAAWWTNTVTVASGCSVNLGANPTSTCRANGGAQTTTGIVNNGTIVVASGTWTVNGWACNLVNNGTITQGGSALTFDSDYGALVNATGATFNLSGSTLSLTGDVDTFTNYGTLKLTGDQATVSTPTLGAASTVTYNATSGSRAIKNWTYNNLLIEGTGGTFTLPAALTASGVTITAGTLDASASNYGVTVAGNWTKNAGGGFTARSGTVTLNGTNQTMSGSTSFWNLTKTVASADTLTLAAGTTQTVEGTLTLNGAASNLLSLRSTVNGQQFNVNPQGTRTVSYLDVQDSNNTNATLLACATGCQTSGNNTNWGTGTTPAISSVSASALTTSATVTWTSDPAGSSRVEYGPMASYGALTTETDTSPRVTSHSRALSSLISCATYHYRALSKDTWEVQGASADQTFQTTGCPASAGITAQSGAVIPSSAAGSVALEGTGTGITLTVPAGSTAQPEITYQINQIPPATVFATVAAPDGRSVVGQTYELKALSGSTVSVSSFSKPLTISIQYAAAEIEGLDEETLAIQRYDGSQWHELSACTVNAATRTVSCTTTAFSTFALFGQSSASARGSGWRHLTDGGTGGGAPTQQQSPSLAAADTGNVSPIIVGIELAPAETETTIVETPRRGVSTGDTPRDEEGLNAAFSGRKSLEEGIDGTEGTEGTEVNASSTAGIPPVPIAGTRGVETPRRGVSTEDTPKEVQMIERERRIEVATQAVLHAMDTLAEGVKTTVADGVNTMRMAAGSFAQEVGDAGRLTAWQTGVLGDALIEQMAESQRLAVSGIAAIGQRIIVNPSRVILSQTHVILSLSKDAVRSTYDSIAATVRDAGTLAAYEVAKLGTIAVDSVGALADSVRARGGIAGRAAYALLETSAGTVRTGWNAARDDARSVLAFIWQIGTDVRSTTVQVASSFTSAYQLVMNRTWESETDEKRVTLRRPGVPVLRDVASQSEAPPQHDTPGRLEERFSSVAFISILAKGSASALKQSASRVGSAIATMGNSIALAGKNVAVAGRNSVQLTMTAAHRGVAVGVHSVVFSYVAVTDGITSLVESGKDTVGLIAWKVGTTDRVETPRRGVSTEEIAEDSVAGIRGSTPLTTGESRLRAPEIAQHPSAPQKYRTALYKQNGQLLIASLHLSIFDALGEPSAHTPVTLFSVPKVALTNSDGIATFHDVETGTHQLAIEVAEDVIERRSIVLEPPSGLTIAERQRVDVVLPVVQVVMIEPSHGSAPLRLTPLAWAIIAALVSGNAVLGVLMWKRRKLKRK